MGLKLSAGEHAAFIKHLHVIKVNKTPGSY